MVALALAVMTTCVLPMFLVAAHSPALRADFGWDIVVVGGSFSAFFLASALASVPAGVLADRLPPAVTVRVAIGGSAAVLVGLQAMPAGSPPPVLAGLLACGGVSLALAQTGTSGLFARGVPRRRQGLAFGIRQMAIPTATLVAGLSVVALDPGAWRSAVRWGLVVAGLVLVLVQVTSSRMPSTPARAPAVLSTAGLPTTAARATPALVRLGLAAAAAGAGGSAIGAFFVESLLDAGHQVDDAGRWLMAGSVVGLLARPVWGVVGDRMREPIRLLILLMGLGAVGTSLLAVGGEQPVLLLGTLLAFATGWAWTGVMSFVAVGSGQGAPAVASGIVSTGNFAGGAAGPFAFGLVAAHWSYAAAWLGCAALFTVGTVLAVLAARALPVHTVDVRRPS